MFEYVMIGLAVVGALVLLVIAGKMVDALVKWIGSIIKFYKTYGNRKAFMAKIRETETNHFEMTKFDGYMPPNNVIPLIERLEWINDNTEQHVSIKAYGKNGMVMISFLDDRDAIAYKLRWI